MARQGIRDVRLQLLTVVTDDRLEGDGDAELVEHLRDVQRIGVDLLRREQLAADGDDGRRRCRRVHIVNQAGHVAIAMRITSWP